MAGVHTRRLALINTQLEIENAWAPLLQRMNDQPLMMPFCKIRKQPGISNSRLGTYCKQREALAASHQCGGACRSRWGMHKRRKMMVDGGIPLCITGQINLNLQKKMFGIFRFYVQKSIRKMPGAILELSG